VRQLEASTSLSGQNGAMSDLPDPPYWAAIFTSRRNERPGDGYEQTADRMFDLACEQPGFLGYETARSDGLGITVSYWRNEADIAAWKAQAEHVDAQREGRARWYDAYDLRIARVERAYGSTSAS
jgi:heme-degrading monooxygenase HmoA